LGLSIDVVELVLSFPSNLKSTQSVCIRILKVRSVILELILYQFRFNLWSKLRSAILKLWTIIIDDWSANLCFKSSYWLELRGFYTPSSETSLNLLENWSQARKKRNNIIEEEFEEGELKNRTRNRKSSWCILSFTLFSCCAVV
jgi:hypothetical protein